MKSHIAEFYQDQFRLNCNSMIQTLIAVRDKPEADIDEKIKAIKLCIDRLPIVMRGLVFQKNTQKSSPSMDPDSPSGAT